ncbi:MAG: PIN domain-containing protein [Archaeoglobales archaeon]|uniref:PIN domain-containing protein n=1 Tax=Archaeoglobus fulgidus TaxID=2234 RepID=A0A7J3M1J9_ARCFL|nr:PIN domain-containing protein [Archaeoglobales archaeon]
MEKVLIDTNVLVNFLLRTKFSEKSKEIIKTALTLYFPVIFVNIFEEAIFILIREELKSKGISEFYDQKEFLEKHGYENLFIHRKFMDFLRKAEINVLENRFESRDFLWILEEYRLFPNDALIAATCKHYGIKKIATFDEDFKRVDFLEVLEL